MKKIIFSALVLALSVGTIQAQSTSGEKSKTHKKEHRMGGYDQLNLSADQKARLQTLKENYKQQSQALRNNKSISEQDQKARHQELRNSFRAQVDAILTAEQRTQLDKTKAGRKPAGKAGKKDFKSKEYKSKGDRRDAVTSRKGADRGAAFEKELNLTADQQTRIQNIRTSFRTRFEDIRNKPLTQEQRKTQMQDLMKEQQAQIKSVLTKEQVEKMQSLRKDRPARNTKK